MLAALVAGTLVFASFLVLFVIWPAYQRPSNRTYDSHFGYPAVRRAMGLPFTVETVPVQTRKMVSQLLGEGRVASQPIRVPVVPRARVLSVLVREGQRVTKGQLLAEMDTTFIQLQVDSGKLLVESAQAELERVKLGSSYTLSQERPEKEGINLEVNKKQIEILRERHASMLKLYSEAAVSRAQLLEVESKLNEAERELKSSELSVNVSAQGQPQSVAIAESNLKQQQNQLQQAMAQLADYQVHAPADGILEGVLIQPGEYNQTTGETGFVIASDLWFEAHLDQVAIHKVTVGNKAQVQLEALAGEMVEGMVTRIVPIVTYSSTGPELKRPVRTTGTGTPEWPTTFSVIVEFSKEINNRLAPGLTGFARIESEREALAVPAEAITPVSNREGLVNVFSNGKRSLKRVVMGESCQGWSEILEGLTLGDTVAAAGHQDLQPADKVRLLSAAR